MVNPRRLTRHKRVQHGETATASSETTELLDLRRAIAEAGTETQRLRHKVEEAEADKRKFRDAAAEAEIEKQSLRRAASDLEEQKQSLHKEDGGYRESSPRSSTEATDSRITCCSERTRPGHSDAENQRLRTPTCCSAGQR